MMDMGPPLKRQPLVPLALVLCLHLLLVQAWMTGAAHSPRREAPEPASTFVLVRPAPESRPEPAASAAPPRAPPPRAPARLPLTATAPMPAPAALETSEPVPVEAPAAALPGELLATSKRMAGGIDRELRQGGSAGNRPITAEPERKWERFAAAFAAARTSVSRDTLLESHSAADGVIIYRKTVGDRVACYRSGSVGGLGPADGQSAGNIACPTGVSWTRQF